MHDHAAVLIENSKTVIKNVGPVLVNDLQTIPSPLKRSRLVRYLLVYVSDDFKTN